jgi:hypothetical protein
MPTLNELGLALLVQLGDSLRSRFESFTISVDSSKSNPITITFSLRD